MRQRHELLSLCLKFNVFANCSGVQYRVIILFEHQACHFLSTFQCACGQAMKRKHSFDMYTQLYGERNVTICNNLRIKNQLDVTCYFIALIGSTCFEHYYAHHQELATMLLITTLVVSFLVCCVLEVWCG